MVLVCRSLMASLFTCLATICVFLGTASIQTSHSFHWLFLFLSSREDHLYILDVKSLIRYVIRKCVLSFFSHSLRYPLNEKHFLILMKYKSFPLRRGADQHAGDRLYPGRSPRFTHVQIDVRGRGHTRVFEFYGTTFRSPRSVLIIYQA